MTSNKTILILLLLATVVYPKSQSIGAFGGGLGFGYHEGERTIGCGSFVSLGYRHPTRFNILLVEAGVTRGEFGKLFCVTDVRPQEFTTTNLTVGLSADIFRLWLFSFSTSFGFSIDYTKGTLAPGGEMQHQDYVDIKKWSDGVYLKAGIGLNIFRDRYRISAIPINVYIGAEMAKQYPMIELSVRIPNT